MVNLYLALAKDGDKEALEIIFQHYKNSILNFNKGLYIKGGDRDDLLQEGYIGLLKAIKAFDETKQTSFKHFANICIKRQIITAIKTSTALKRQISYNCFLEENLNLDEFVASSFSPENIILEKEFAIELKEYLNTSLSPLEKKVFMYIPKGYTYNEISKILNEPPKKIDNTMQRIRLKILYFLKYT